MTELDLELQGLSFELINEFGKTISYSIISNDAYDPSTSQTLPDGPPFDIKAIVEDINPLTLGTAAISAGLVESGDKRLSVAPEYFANKAEPSQADTFVCDGATYTVPEKGVIKFYSGDLVALYQILGRI